MSPSPKGGRAIAVTGSRLTLWICIALGVLLTITTALDRMGIKLLQQEFNLIGCLVLLMLLLGLGAFALTKRVRANVTRTFVRAVCVLALLLGGTLLAARLLQYGALFYPQYRRTVASPGGREAVVLRQVDMGGDDEESAQAMIRRMDTRLENIEGAKEDLEEEGYPRGAYGYIFTMYPKMLGLFYDTRAESEGAIYLGVETNAKLHYDWVSEGELRVTIDGAEPGDEGEITLRF